MTPTELEEYVSKLKTWMRDQNITRSQLAADLGISKGTLDNWCSKGFPEWGIKAVARLMHPLVAEGDDLEVSFTTKEFDRIEEARRLVGSPTRKAFYEEAILEYVSHILAREATEQTKSATNITDFASGLPKAAETPPPYRTDDDKTGTED